MDSERWRAVDRVFQSAVFSPIDQRKLILDRDCGADLELRNEVEALLAAHDRASSFIEAPGFVSPVRPVQAARQENLRSGQRIASFTIRGVLGRGGMGVVYEAEQDHPRRRVALKLIRPGIDSPDIQRRFVQEAALLARLTHPCVAQVYEGGTAETPQGPQPYFAMEIVPGEPITAFARNQALNIRERLELALHVCDAVQHAHEKGVLHRDLKPGNILVTPDGRLKVVDFGVARDVDEGSTSHSFHTEAGRLLGTLAYISPEQLSGDTQAVDTRSDLYSLGVVLFELIADRLPYDLGGRGLMDAARMIQEQRPPALRTVRRDLPADLDTIVQKALEKEPGRRYATADALGGDIRRLLENRPILARPPNAAYYFRKLVQRNRAASAIVGFLAMGLIGLTAISIWLAMRHADQRDAATAAMHREADERETAEQAVSFLAGLFAQAKPGEMRTAPARTDRELLDAGVARLETELGDRPLVRARLMKEIGLVYGQLADYPKALALLRPAVEIVRAERGNYHMDLIDPLSGLADALGRSRALEEQHKTLLEILSITQHNFGQHHQRTAEAFSALGQARFYAGDNEAALNYFEQTLGIEEQLAGEESAAYARELHNVGSSLRNMGRIEEAEAALRRALDIRQRIGDQPEEIGRSLEALAHVAHRKNDLAAAERYLTEQVALYRQHFHDRHPTLAFAMNNLAFITQAHRGPEAAEPIYRNTLEMRRFALGSMHPDVAYTLDHLGTNQVRLSRFDHAIAFYSEALEIRLALFGERDEVGASILLKLGDAYLRAGRLVEAESLLREHYESISSSKGAIGPHAIPALESLVAVSRGLRRSAELADLLMSLGQSYVAKPAPQAANAAFCEALDIYEQCFGAAHHQTTAARELTIDATR